MLVTGFPCVGKSIFIYFINFVLSNFFDKDIIFKRIFSTMIFVSYLERKFRLLTDSINFSKFIIISFGGGDLLSNKVVFSIGNCVCYFISNGFIIILNRCLFSRILVLMKRCYFETIFYFKKRYLSNLVISTSIIYNINFFRTFYEYKNNKK